MHVLNRAGVAALATAAAAVSIALAVPANADTGAQTGDVVGVGSDTLQNGIDFVLDGSPGVAGGYNSTGNLNRAVNVDATGDANGRATYDGTCGAVSTTTGVGANCDTTSNSAGNLLAGSVVLRAGTKPVIRPNGSGGGAAALIADANTGYQGLPNGSLQFARMSRLPNSTEIGNCANVTACGSLHVYQVATDNLAIARVNSGFNGPTGLSAQELIGIYTCQTTKWNQLPGNSTGSTATIHPLIPQSGSGTRNFFLADLQASNNGTAVTPGSCVRTVQEHDPSGVYTDPSPADVIEPFSTGKLALINSGYYSSGVSPATNTAFAKNYLTTETGTTGDANAVYSSTRGLYVAVRQTDVASTTPFQPGATQNFVQALFTGGASAIRSAAGKAQLSYAGFTPAYKDCLTNPTSC